MMSPTGLAVTMKVALPRPPRKLVAAGIHGAGFESVQSLSRHLKTFHRRLHLGRPVTKPDGDALGGAARVYRDEIAPDHNVVDLRFRFRPFPFGWHSHIVDLSDQFRRNFNAQLPSRRDLPGSLGCGVHGILAGQRGVGRDIGGGGGEVVHQDVAGARERVGAK